MNPPKGIAHWDEVEIHRRERGEMAASWRFLGNAAGTKVAGVNRVQRSSPAASRRRPHSHSVSEEIFFVLGGSGHSW